MHIFFLSYDAWQIRILMNVSNYILKERLSVRKTSKLLHMNAHFDGQTSHKAWNRFMLNSIKLHFDQTERDKNVLYRKGFRKSFPVNIVRVPVTDKTNITSYVFFYFYGFSKCKGCLFLFNSLCFWQISSPTHAFIKFNSTTCISLQ